MRDGAGVVRNVAGVVRNETDVVRRPVGAVVGQMGGYYYHWGMWGVQSALVGELLYCGGV